jgi:hypothetical protein
VTCGSATLLTWYMKSGPIGFVMRGIVLRPPTSQGDTHCAPPVRLIEKDRQ